MGFLKGLGLAVISILLFLSLLVTGVGVTLNFTALNPGFINRQIDDLDVTALLSEGIDDSPSSGDVPQAIREFLNNELPDYSEEIKAAVKEANNRFYDYLLGRTDTLDLKVVFGETILDPELIYSLADKINWPNLADELIREEIAENGGIDPAFVYLLDYIDDAAVKLEPWFKDSLREIVPPVHDYLLGQSQTLDIHISLEEPATVLYETLFDVFNRFPPPELAGLSPDQRQMAFNAFFFFELIPTLPTEINIDSAFFSGAPQNLNQAFTDLKTEVDRVKGYVTTYWMVFYGLILFIVVLLALAFLITGRAKKALLFGGIVFFVFGLIGFVSAMVANSMAPGFDFGGVPAAVDVWLPEVIQDALRPFLFFSIGAGVLGIAGILASVLMHPHPPQPPAVQPPGTPAS
jgi:hypothetical protein